MLLQIETSNYLAKNICTTFAKYWHGHYQILARSLPKISKNFSKRWHEIARTLARKWKTLRWPWKNIGKNTAKQIGETLQNCILRWTERFMKKMFVLTPVTQSFKCCNVSETPRLLRRSVGKVGHRSVMQSFITSNLQLHQCIFNIETIPLLIRVMEFIFPIQNGDEESESHGFTATKLLKMYE